MKRKVFLLIASIAVVAVGHAKPAAALKPTPKPTPFILCQEGCDNSSQCTNSTGACIICFHPENHCG